MATILIDKNVMVPMRDGVRLATDVYWLDGAAPAPVLLSRTPYDKEHALVGSTGVPFDILRAVQAGYAVMIQDVRGRYGSEGEFDPMFQETRDGVDTIAWAAGQPWSRGVVGTFGGSYVGGTQWLPAREHPPALRAMAPAVTFSDMYEGNTYQGGAKVLHDLRWVVADIIPGEIRRRVMRGGKPPEGAASLDVNAVLADLPLADHPLIRALAPFYGDWLAHSTPDAYWRPISPSTGYEQITAPSLNISGWYDIFLWSTFQNYLGMRQRGGTERTRRNQRVIIGPWTHMNFTGSFPEREFGVAGSHDAIDLTGIQLRWFDRWLKEADNGVEEEPPVMLFVMGIDAWRTEADWPLPDTDFTGKLVDVYPDGRALILTEGILRARYRTSFTAPELLEPDAIYELRLDLWATANVFLPGHRIRLEVSSSNFPRFNRNSNTGGEIASEAADHYRPAINRIFHDVAHPSRLILPIIER